MTRSCHLAFVSAVVMSVAVTSIATASSVCNVAYANGQTRQTEGRLIEARKELQACVVFCAAEVAPVEKGVGGISSTLTWKQQDCTNWLAKVLTRIPRIVFDAKDTNGALVEITQVADTTGKVWAAGTTGRSVELDPGKYMFLFTAKDGRSSAVPIVVAEGSEGRVRATFVVAAPAKRTNVLMWAGFGVGSAGILVGTVMGLVAMDKSSTLKDSCKDSLCIPAYHDDLNQAKRYATISTISFAAGILGTGFGLWGLFAPPAATATSPDSGKPASAISVRLVVGLGTLGLAGAF